MPWHANEMLLFFVVAVLWIPVRNCGAQQEQQQCIHCPEYVQMTAAEKERIIMEHIVAGEYDQLPDLEGTCAAGYDWQAIDFNNQFDRFSDERPAGMNRFFHRNAITASVEFVANTNNNNFTGIFRGAQHGVLRWSPLAPLLVQPFLVNQFIGTFFFSFGLKFFRNGMHSANILTGDTLKGRTAYAASRKFYDKPDFNIFSRPVDNMPGIDRNGPLFGPNEFQSGVISTADAAAYDVEGREEVTPKAPLVVKFQPNPIFVQQFGRVATLDFRTWAPYEIDAGTLLYTVFSTVDRLTREPSLCVDADGVPQVDDDVDSLCPNQQVVQLGDVVMTSRFYASKWSDEKLYFQHTRVCPKDQAICDTNNGAGAPTGVENLPGAIFADTKDLCLSDDGTDGALSGVPPACPAGLSALADNCFPGVVRGVEATQVQQCPFMQIIAEEILGDSQGEIVPENCSFFSSLSSATFGIVLCVVAAGIRTVLWSFQIFQ